MKTMRRLTLHLFLRVTYSNQNTVALLSKQTNRSVEQKRQARDKPTHVWTDGSDNGTNAVQ